MCKTCATVVRRTTTCGRLVLAGWLALTYVTAFVVLLR